MDIMASNKLLKGLLIYTLYLLTLILKVSWAEDVDFEIQEEQEAGTVIGGIIGPSGLSQKYDADVLSQMEFSLLTDIGDVESNDYFSVDQTSGELSLSAKIDRDSICMYRDECILTLGISARAVGPPQIFETINVKVSITDINDNQPIFPSVIEHLIIPENSPVGSTFPLPEAIDKDNGENGVRSYELEPNTPTFNISTTPNSDGSIGIQLIVSKVLDRETQPNYLINLKASDAGTPMYSASLLLNITIGDYNDNIAQFTQDVYIADVMEDLEVPSVVITVKATDNDEGDAGKVTYGFTTKTETLYGDIFSINVNTGDISLLKPLDFETENEYILSVMAKDSAPNARTSQATVNVHVHDVNDFEPQIIINNLMPNGQVEVKENAILETFVAHISVVDKDSRRNGEVSCELDTMRYSLLNSGNKQYRLVTASSLDRETVSLDQVRIICSDRGEPQLSSEKTLLVSVLDENDNPPIFEKSKYTVVIQENNPKGMYISTVLAQDDDMGINSVIRYSILESDAEEMFDIDPNNGMIKAEKEMDYERQHELMFHVIAQDNGEESLSATATVQIQLLDTNDNAPQFTQSDSQINFIVVENQAAGVKIGQIQATDADSAPFDLVKYRFQDETSEVQSWFDLDQSTGILRSKQSFDREMKSLYHFNVVAYNPDASLLSTTTVVNVYVEDTNDMNPVFLFPNRMNHTVQIPRTLTAGELVTQVKAEDMDDGNNGWVRFDLVGGNEDGYFIIGDTSGLITVTKDLAQSQVTYFNLSLEARDHGVPPRITRDWLLVALNATAPTDEGFPANMIILVSLVSITGILMVLLLVAIVWLVYKSRYHANRRRKYESTEDEPKTPPPVEIIDRLPTAHLQTHNQSSFRDQEYKYNKDSNRPGQLNSHTSADSGFDEHNEMTMSPHGKHVTFHIDGPTESSDFVESKNDRLQEEDGRSSTSEEGSNTDSGCVLCETGTDVGASDAIPKQPTSRPVYHVECPSYQTQLPLYKTQPLTYMCQSHKGGKGLKHQKQKLNSCLMVPKPKGTEIKSQDKMKKLNTGNNWPILNPVVESEGHDTDIVEPHLRSFCDSSSVMNYKMDTTSQRCASELTDDTSSTSGSYIINGEERVNC